MGLSFYFGDKFQVNEAIKERKVEISSKDDQQISIQSIRWRDISIGQFFHICKAMPFGTDIQIIIITIDLAISKTNKKKVEKWDHDLDIILQRSLEIPKHSEVLFDFSPESTSNNVLEKLANFGEVFIFENLKGQKLINWTTKRVKDKGLNLDQKILKELSYSNANNLWQLDNEIEKLALLLEVSEFKNNNDISEFISQDKEVKIFELVDALIKGDKLRSLILGGRLYKEGYSFMYVLTILSREIRLLILGKFYLQEGLTGNNLAKKLRIYHPFRIRKILEQLHQISFENLQLLYKGLSNVEYGIKKGNHTEKQVFESIIAFTSKI